jgi:polyferredoxin
VSAAPQNVASVLEIPQAGIFPISTVLNVAETFCLSRKKLVRRDDREYSQPLRLGVQLAFLAVNLWIGTQFYYWVRWAESSGQSRMVERPAGVEGWLPIQGLMQFKYVLATGQVPQVHPAGFFLLVAFAVISFLLRKSFCGWLCPVGTASEYLWKLGRYTFRRNFHLPRAIDLPLRALKYLVLAFFLYAVGSMSAAAIAEFLASPYALIVDVRMLNFFRYLGTTAAFVILGLVLASIFVQNFWCRYLCPYGALMGLVASFSLLRITRNQNSCIDCGKCAKACPSALPVDKLVQIRSAECMACLECVAVCPAKDTLLVAVAAPRVRRTIPVWSVAAGIAIIFCGLVGYAKLTGRWETHLPKQLYFQLVPAANEPQHPMVDR